MKFAVVGGDKRSALLSVLLAKDGHRVYTFALEKAELPAEIPKAHCLQGCVYGADCVVLPVPAENGRMLNSPLSEERLSMEELISALWPGQVLCGGTF
ncbi:MAG: dipicolinate synthase, partial [Oscillospiraceae bacterium]|nr:dipicolinate synthase [Oscillospiraceae bacterium]